MMEVEEEATYVPQHKIRIALFFAAMRHFADRLRDKGTNVIYSYIDDKDNRGSFEKEITRWIHKTRPRKLVCTLPGDHRVKETVKRIAAELDCRLEIRDDNHFLVSAEEFSEFARGKKSLLLEHFYRHMRRRYGILMDDGQPVAGKWNFDQENRQSFGKEGPAKIKAPRSFRPDESTEAVLKLVNNRFSDSPVRWTSSITQSVASKPWRLCGILSIIDCQTLVPIKTRCSKASPTFIIPAYLAL
jgi:deoxyribodipyrimidine photolyase-related protein